MENTCHGHYLLHYLHDAALYIYITSCIYIQCCYSVFIIIKTTNIHAKMENSEGYNLHRMYIYCTITSDIFYI